MVTPEETRRRLDLVHVATGVLMYQGQCTAKVARSRLLEMTLREGIPLDLMAGATVWLAMHGRQIRNTEKT